VGGSRVGVVGRRGEGGNWCRRELSPIDGETSVIYCRAASKQDGLAPDQGFFDGPSGWRAASSG
jgi:hypothetical protein